MGIQIPVRREQMSTMSFSIPRTIFYGEGSLGKLAGLKGKRAAIVTGGSSMKKFGFLDQAQALLAKAGIESIIIDGVEPNPSVETVKKGGETMLAFAPDWIVAIGGGPAEFRGYHHSGEHAVATQQGQVHRHPLH